MSHFVNRRTLLAGAKLTLLEFLLSTGLATSTLLKIKIIYKVKYETINLIQFLPGQGEN